MINKKNEEPMSNQQFIASMGMLTLGGVSLWAYKHENYLDHVYYRNFHAIYFLAVGVLALFLTYAAYKYVKRHQDLFRRYYHLKPLGQRGFDRIFVGKTDDQMSITISDQARLGHVQVIGATGRGKTESVIIPWAVSDLNRQRTVVIIDGKGDPELSGRIQNGTMAIMPPDSVFEFNLASPKTSCTINPLGFGTPQQIVDRLFRSLTFEEPYFKQVQFEICSHIVSALTTVQREVTFNSIYRAFSEDIVLKDLAASVPKDLSTPLVKWLMESKEKRDEKTAGLRAQLSPFAVGELAPLVNGEVKGMPYLSLSEQVTRLNQSSERLLVFSIPTLMYQETAKILGKMILQELGFSVSWREQNDIRTFTSVFLDEFSAFVYPEFVQILNKARSSGVAIHLSHQSIGDLKEISPSFATTVNTNTNVKCVLGVNDPETADFFAKHMGTNTTGKMTEQILQEEGDFEIKRTGRKSLREVEAYKIHPNDLKHFTHGRGAIHFIENKIPYTEIIQFEAMQ